MVGPPYRRQMPDSGVAAAVVDLTKMGVECPVLPLPHNFKNIKGRLAEGVRIDLSNLREEDISGGALSPGAGHGLQLPDAMIASSNPTPMFSPGLSPTAGQSCSSPCQRMSLPAGAASPMAGGIGGVGAPAFAVAMPGSMLASPCGSPVHGGYDQFAFQSPMGSPMHGFGMGGFGFLDGSAVPSPPFGPMSTPWQTPMQSPMTGMGFPPLDVHCFGAAQPPAPPFMDQCMSTKVPVLDDSPRKAAAMLRNAAPDCYED
mmetsp:Transcript_33823/g.75657  ORF Transcript_33823/g.75657 Transcript_33823/m.75657 type:complete len:258 (-) Transcript_33823:569-1342(-)